MTAVAKRSEAAYENYGNMTAQISNVSLREQVADILRNDILCGRLAEGERLNEADLAKRFKVSRTPIREALQQLTYEGLLEGRRNSGVTVAQRTHDSIGELVVPIRRSVEAFALRSYFHTIGEADFAVWDAILEKMRQGCQSGNFSSTAEQDIAFHRALVRRAGQQDLDSIWSAILSRVRHHFWENQKRVFAHESPMSLYDDHVRLLEVFRRGDVDEAVDAITRHIR